MAHLSAGVKDRVGMAPTEQISHDSDVKGSARPLSSATWVASPLPANNAPWEQVLEELLPRAKAGDEPAASRLYQDLERCRRYWGVTRSATAAMREKLSEVVRDDAQASRELQSADAMLSVLDDNERTCKNSNPTMLDAQRYGIVLQAAELGNESAAACYVFGAFGEVAQTRLNDTYPDYKSNARGFLATGIGRGDWRMLDQAISLYEPRMVANLPAWRHGVVAPDPTLAYTYVMVQLIGARMTGNNDEINSLAGFANDIANAASLTAVVRARALDTAQNLFREDFSAHPYVPRDELTWCD